jgi:polygalacturonase
MEEIHSKGDDDMDDTTMDALRADILSRISEPRGAGPRFSLADFGADPTGKRDNSGAFARALSTLSAGGGGTLVVPAGEYLMEGALRLVSDLRLVLEKGANVRFASRPECYLPPVFTSWEGTFLNNYSPLVYGRGLKNIAVVGAGSIGVVGKEPWTTWRKMQKKDQLESRRMNREGVPHAERVFGEGHFLRPPLLQLFECEGILLEGILIEDSPFWCVHLLACRNATLRGLRYRAFCVNNDGIDLEYCRDVLIEDIEFGNGDDNVAIKAGRDHEGRSRATPSENILVRGCRFKGLHAVVIGSEMSAGVRNVLVEDCAASGYLKRGVYLKSNADRGGFIRDVYVRNVVLQDVEDCLYITSFYFNEGAGHETDISHILVQNLSAKRASGTGIVIQGYPGRKVRDVHLRKLTIESAANAISLSDAEDIVLSDVVIGKLAAAPTTAS